MRSRAGSSTLRTPWWRCSCARKTPFLCPTSRKKVGCPSVEKVEEGLQTDPLSATATAVFVWCAAQLADELAKGPPRSRFASVVALCCELLPTCAPHHREVHEKQQQTNTATARGTLCRGIGLSGGFWPPTTLQRDADSKTFLGTRSLQCLHPPFPR